jgi:tetratricopeptide (TPR) repeat protein
MKTMTTLFLAALLFIFNKASSQTAQEYYQNAYKLYHDSIPSYDELTLVNKALQLDPAYEDAHMLRAEILCDKKKNKEAIKDANYCVNAKPKNTDYLIKRSQIFVKMQKGDMAINDLNKVLELEPAKIDAYYFRGLVKMNFFNKYDDAITDLSKFIETMTVKYKADAFLNRGRCYQMQEKNDLALQDFNNAVKFDPFFKEAYLQRGIMQNDLGGNGCNDIRKYKDLGGKDGQKYFEKYCMGGKD